MTTGTLTYSPGDGDPRRFSVDAGLVERALHAYRDALRVDMEQCEPGTCETLRVELEKTGDALFTLHTRPPCL